MAGSMSEIEVKVLANQDNQALERITRKPHELPIVMQEHEMAQEQIVRDGVTGAIDSVIESVNAVSRWIEEWITKDKDLVKLQAGEKIKGACDISKNKLTALKTTDWGNKLHNPKEAEGLHKGITDALKPVNDALKAIKDEAKQANKSAFASSAALQKIAFSRLPASFSMSLGMSKIWAVANHVIFLARLSNQKAQNRNFEDKIESIKLKAKKTPEEQAFLGRLDKLLGTLQAASLAEKSFGNIDAKTGLRKLFEATDTSEFMKYANKFSENMAKFHIPEIKNAPEKLKVPVEWLNKKIRECNTWAKFVQGHSETLFKKVAASEFQTTPMKIASGLALGCLSILAPLAMILPLAIPAAGIAVAATAAVSGITAGISALLGVGLAALGVSFALAQVFGGAYLMAERAWPAAKDLLAKFSQQKPDDFSYDPNPPPQKIKPQT